MVDRRIFRPIEQRYIFPCCKMFSYRYHMSWCSPSCREFHAIFHSKFLKMLRLVSKPRTEFRRWSNILPPVIKCRTFL